MNLDQQSRSWDPDADAINISDDWNAIVLVDTPRCMEFLSSADHDKKFFIVAPKGYGKTLLLKHKSHLYRDTKTGAVFIPETQLCEKLGQMTMPLSVQTSVFHQYDFWTSAWLLGLMVLVHRRYDLTLPSPISKVVARAHTLTDIMNTLLTERKQIYELFPLINSALSPGLSAVQRPTYVFLDNADVFFEKYFPLTAEDGDLGSGMTIWVNGQLGLMEAALRITTISKHIKVFASIRAEAYKRNPGQTALQADSYATQLDYRKGELQRIFEENIKNTVAHDLVAPVDSAPIPAFLGFSVIEQQFYKEAAFDFLYRHTFQRPREIIILGQRIKALAPSDRSRDAVIRMVERASKDLLEQFKRELMPPLDGNVYEAFCRIAFSNVLSGHEIARLTKRVVDDGWGEDFFSLLYDRGLLGHVVFHEGKKTGEQRFKSSASLALGEKSALPIAEYYVVHPALYDDMHLHQGVYEFHEKNPIGYDMPFATEFAPVEDGWHVHFGAGHFGLGFVVPLLALSTPFAVVQRPGAKWDGLASGSAVTVLRRGERTGQELCVVRELNREGLAELKAAGRNLLVLSDDPAIVGVVLEGATSLSTALGPAGLRDWPRTLKASSFLPVRESVNVYPFENSREAVERLRNTLTAEYNGVYVVPVIADRICSKIGRRNGRLTVTAEEYGLAIIRGINPEVYSLFKENLVVQVTNSNREHDFYVKRKIGMVNGLHVMVALLGYGELSDSGASKSQKAKTLVPLVLKLKRPAVDVFIEAQALRLIVENTSDLVERISGRNTPQAFRDLVAYGHDVVKRILGSGDVLGRILGVNDKRKIVERYRERVGDLKAFVEQRGEEVDVLAARVQSSVDSKKILKVLKGVDAQVAKVLNDQTK
jgi:hypothetical protein